MDQKRGGRVLIIFTFEKFQDFVESFLKWPNLLAKLTNWLIDKQNWQTNKFTKEQRVKELDLVGAEFGNNIDKHHFDLKINDKVHTNLLIGKIKTRE